MVAAVLDGDCQTLDAVVSAKDDLDDATEQKHMSRKSDSPAQVEEEITAATRSRSDDHAGQQRSRSASRSSMDRKRLLRKSGGGRSEDDGKHNFQNQISSKDAEKDKDDGNGLRFSGHERSRKTSYAKTISMQQKEKADRKSSVLSSLNAFLDEQQTFSLKQDDPEGLSQSEHSALNRVRGNKAVLERNDPVDLSQSEHSTLNRLRRKRTGALATVPNSVVGGQTNSREAVRERRRSRSSSGCRRELRNARRRSLSTSRRSTREAQSGSDEDVGSKVSGASTHRRQYDDTVEGCQEIKSSRVTTTMAQNGVELPPGFPVAAVDRTAVTAGGSSGYSYDGRELEITSKIRERQQQRQGEAAKNFGSNETSQGLRGGSNHSRRGRRSCFVQQELADGSLTGQTEGTDTVLINEPSFRSRSRSNNSRRGRRASMVHQELADGLTGQSEGNDAVLINEPSRRSRGSSNSRRGRRSIVVNQELADGLTGQTEGNDAVLINEPSRRSRGSSNSRRGRRSIVVNQDISWETTNMTSKEHDERKPLKKQVEKIPESKKTQKKKKVTLDDAFQEDEKRRRKHRRDERTIVTENTNSTAASEATIKTTNVSEDIKVPGKKTAFLGMRGFQFLDRFEDLVASPGAMRLTMKIDRSSSREALESFPKQAPLNDDSSDTSDQSNDESIDTIPKKPERSSSMGGSRQNQQRRSSLQDTSDSPSDSTHEKSKAETENSTRPRRKLSKESKGGRWESFESDDSGGSGLSSSEAVESTK